MTVEPAKWRMSRRARWALAAVGVLSFAGGLWFGYTDPGDGSTVELRNATTTVGQ